MTAADMSIAEALAYLDSHINLETILATRQTAPSIDRIRQLVGIMGDPQNAYPVIHITGTNGKGSTARLVTALLSAHNLSVGTYTSPDLQKVNERLSWNGTPISDEGLARLLASLADLETLMSSTPSRFDLLTAAALGWFADIAVDVAVLEVGLGGKWDATNVADAAVAVVTNVELDHTELLGPERADIAAEKAGIVKPGSTLVLGETDPALRPIFEATGPAALWLRARDYEVTSNRLAVGGRLLSVRTPGASYDDVFLALHGPHQGDNAATALAAVEAFFGKPVAPEVVAEAFAGVASPGRLEIVGRRPLVVLDGAHNLAGARALAAAVAEEFASVEKLVMVVGMLHGKDPAELLNALGVGRAALVVATMPPSAGSRGRSPEDVAAAAEGLGVASVSMASVSDAVDRAVKEAGEDGMVLVTGSLYVVGAARAALVGGESHHL
ncbi:MAG TPA: Mur ligase family protein [Acidimicrobiales bacterium]|nr:Mur ligase family protein [Acidimicrobiales bacterium]